MNFPSFPTFTGRLFITDDLDLSLDLVRAYNDWHIDEWCGAHPGRFIPMAIPAIWDAELTAAEIRRTSLKGNHSLTFSENPAFVGQPSFHSEYWDPVWKACCDTGTVLSLHIGSSGKMPVSAIDAPPDVMIAVTPLNSMSAAADILFSRVLKKFRTCGSPYPRAARGGYRSFLSVSTGRTTCIMSGLRPSSEVGCRATCSASTFWRASSTIPSESHCERMRVDNIAWEADYPHSDSMWPSAPEELMEQFNVNSVSDVDIAKITHENAMRWYSFDPFVKVPREQATVGALRAAAAGHDVSIMSRSIRQRTHDEKLEGYRRPAERALATQR